MNPDLGSERSISYEADFKHALIQMETGRKGADSPVPRDRPGIPPRNVSDSEWIFPRIYKKNISRDTKLAVGRELTKSNLSPPDSSTVSFTQGCTVSSLTGAEQALIRNRGRRVLISQIFTLDHGDNSGLGNG